MASPPYPTDLLGAAHQVLPVDGARRLVIFFGAKDLAHENFNFFQLGRELPETRIFVNNGTNAWYQYGLPGLGDDFEGSINVLKRWRDAVGAEEICTVGTSMGAYAAIQYGIALNARVLAFSSDAVLMGQHSRSARYFVGEAPPSCPDLRAALADHTADITLLVGERDPVDLHAAWQLQQAADASTSKGRFKAISLIGADHIVPSFLSRRARLGPMLRSFVAGNAVPVQPDAGAALAAEGYCEAVFAAHCASLDQDWAAAESAARRALEAYPYGEAASMQLGQALLQQARYADALVWLSSAVASQPADLKTQSQLALALRHLGSPSRARQIHAQILTQNPGYHGAHYALGILHLDEGNLAAAHSAVSAALRLAPKSATYQNRLKDIVKRIKAASSAT